MTDREGRGKGKGRRPRGKASDGIYVCIDGLRLLHVVKEKTDRRSTSQSSYRSWRIGLPKKGAMRRDHEGEERNRSRYVPTLTMGRRRTRVLGISFSSCRREARGQQRWPGGKMDEMDYNKEYGRRRTSSKTFFKPFCVNAEHSTYFTHPSSFARLSPSICEIGSCFTLRSFSFTAGSSRKSSWVPTRMMGTPGQWCFTSGIHFSLTFSNDARDVTLKQTRKTSV